jgi:hypothetical protein
MPLEPSNPAPFDLGGNCRRDGVGPEPNSLTVMALGLAFFAALAIYFAIVESPEQINNDMSEAFAWGREFQLGYHQHPPFWAWICGAWFLVFPHEIWAFGILSAVNATIGLFGAWLLIGDFAQGRKRMAATAFLLLIPCYTLLAFKYNANIIFISIWPITLHYFMKAIDNARLSDAVLFGVFAGLALMSKYYSLILLASCFLVALAHPRRSRYFASASPYLSAVVAAAIGAPHVWWLLTHDAPPVRYLASMSGLPWSDMAGYAGKTMFGVLQMNIVMLLIVAFLARTRPREWIDSCRRQWTDPRFRLLVILVLAPLILTFLSAFVLRTRIFAEMTVGIFPLAPLLAMDFFGARDIDRLWSTGSRLAAAVVVGGVAFSPAISAATVYLSGHAMNIAPYREMAFEATRLWREQVGSPLAFVAGHGRYGQATTFYSPDQPHAFLGFDYSRSPWVTPAALAARGLLSICPADNRRCLDATAEFATPESRRTEVSLAHSAWGHTAKTFHYIVTVIPPRGSRNQFAVLDETKCQDVWTNAVGGGNSLSYDKAGPYITNLKLADPDNDNDISKPEFMDACEKGLVREQS